MPKPKKIDITYFDEGIVEAVVAVSKAMEQAKQAGASRRMIVALIKDYYPSLTKGQISDVLTALADLKNYYVEKPNA